ncbi:AraC family transcriptional regulator [Paenibacillus thermoaerophilus]|uniref:AraC family transcriptional regulator n=1 Tax=Paenibacillus thermoaerophilus TaxID=1215385 RepID=A0ABW2V7N8_9BACL|nr:AraC family transcriptional regulator [Paenibacillus thermoaerophilus]TMV06703.1 AraC family transcriptional regulator [Paenibacillus thermoaerophilus]
MNRVLFLPLTEWDMSLPVYVTGAGGWLNQEPIDRPAGYADYQWIQCVSGEGKLRTRGITYAVKPGQGMLLYPDEPHAYEAVREPWGVRWVTFRGALAGPLLAKLRFRHSGVWNVSHPEAVLERISQIAGLLDSKNPMRGAACSSLAYQLLLDLYGTTTTERSDVRSRQDRLEQLTPLLQYMEDRCAEDLTLEDLSRRLGVTPQYVCRLFRQALDMRPFEYLAKCRIQKAKELLLAQPERKVEEIAVQAGYRNASYFIKQFKRQEGVTPVEFRRMHR